MDGNRYLYIATKGGAFRPPKTPPPLGVPLICCESELSEKFFYALYSVQMFNKKNHNLKQQWELMAVRIS